MVVKRPRILLVTSVDLITLLPRNVVEAQKLKNCAVVRTKYSNGEVMKNYTKPQCLLISVMKLNQKYPKTLHVHCVAPYPSSGEEMWNRFLQGKCGLGVTNFQDVRVVPTSKLGRAHPIMYLRRFIGTCIHTTFTAQSATRSLLGLSIC